MEKESVRQLTIQYDHIKQNGGRWMDKRIRYYVARIFAFQHDLIDMDRFNEIIKDIKKQTGLFASLSREMREMLAAILLANHKGQPTNIDKLINDYSLLVDKKFGRSTFTYAGACMMQLYPVSNQEQVVDKARELYKLLKAEHPFMTGKEYNAIVLALALHPSLLEQSAQDIGETLEFYYQALREIGFKVNDSTQFAAAACTMLATRPDENFVAGIERFCDEVFHAGLKIRPMNYTSTVMLAYVYQEKPFSIEEDLLPYIKTVSDNINMVFEKEFKTSLALSMFLEEKSGTLSAADLNNLSLNLQLLLIQEEIACAATTTAIIASSSNSNN